jgi:aldehyde dehydrogenase (NAD+)
MTPRALFDLQSANRWRMAATTAGERVTRLKRLRDTIRAQRAGICAAIEADFGKHPVEAEVTEIMPVMEELKVAIRELDQWMRPRPARTPLLLSGSRSEVRYEPRGLVLVLSPWNYPFLLAIDPVVAAVAAGNCVILRPSAKTPHTATCLRDLISAAFTEDEVAVVNGERSVGDELLALPFDHVFFTGSTAMGRKVMATAAQHLSSVTLELGGQSPVIVDETANIRTAAERIAWGKFINGGQTCVAPDYALVQETVVEPLATALAESITRFYGDDEAARASSASLAKMVSADACRRLDRAITETVAGGARLVIGGRVDSGSRRITPTVLTGVTSSSPIMAEEIFGPVLPIIAFRRLDEAVLAVRSRPKPLALYVFSRQQANVERVLSSTTAGGSCVNQVVLHLANPHVPFGGVGASGLGNYHGRFGFETMSHARAVYTQAMPTSLKWLFPPYTARSARLVALVRKLVG